MDDKDQLQREIGEWAERTFPGTPMERCVGAVNHMRKEVEELAESLAELQGGGDDALYCAEAKKEVADVVILAMNVAHFMGFSLLDEVRAKHAINLTRTWQAPDANGVCEHVREGEGA